MSVYGLLASLCQEAAMLALHADVQAPYRTRCSSRRRGERAWYIGRQIAPAMLKIFAKWREANTERVTGQCDFGGKVTMHAMSLFEFQLRLLAYWARFQ